MCVALTCAALTCAARSGPRPLIVVPPALPGAARRAGRHACCCEDSGPGKGARAKRICLIAKMICWQPAASQETMEKKAS